MFVWRKITKDTKIGGTLAPGPPLLPMPVCIQLCTYNYYNMRPTISVSSMITDTSESFFPSKLRSLIFATKTKIGTYILTDCLSSNN